MKRGRKAHAFRPLRLQRFLERSLHKGSRVFFRQAFLSLSCAVQRSFPVGRGEIPQGTEKRLQMPLRRAGNSAREPSLYGRRRRHCRTVRGCAFRGPSCREGKRTAAEHAAVAGEGMKKGPEKHVLRAFSYLGKSVSSGPRPSHAPCREEAATPSCAVRAAGADP